MKKRIILLIIALACLLCLCVFPIGLTRMDQNFSSGDTEAYSVTPNLNPGVVCLQGFVAQEAYLKELSFAFQPIDVLPQDTSVQFELLDSQSRVLVSKLYTAADIMDENYCTVTINRWLKKGDIYAYTLTVSGSSGNQLALYTTPNPANFAAGNINLSLNGAPLEGQAYNLYHYTKPLDKKNIFCTWAFIWTVSMCIYALSSKYIKKPQKLYL